jgi:hypothetical protein
MEVARETTCWMELISLELEEEFKFLEIAEIAWLSDR